MEINVIKEEKNELEFQIDNSTIAELLRAYLNNDSAVTLAVWKRNHPTDSPIMLVKTKGKDAKKAIKEAVSQVIDELDKLEADFKKMK